MILKGIKKKFPRGVVDTLQFLDDATGLPSVLLAALVMAYTTSFLPLKT
jgi:hypothetical protein